MPLYEYACENCGHHFERFQSVQDAPVRQCPHCAGRVHKVLHPVGIIFKGSGWYITESRQSTAGATENTTESKSDSPAQTETSAASTTTTST